MTRVDAVSLCLLCERGVVALHLLIRRPAWVVVVLRQTLQVMEPVQVTPLVLVSHRVCHLAVVEAQRDLGVNRLLAEGSEPFYLLRVREPEHLCQ